jgi:hypothetical protein
VILIVWRHNTTKHCAKSPLKTRHFSFLFQIVTPLWTDTSLANLSKNTNYKQQNNSLHITLFGNIITL